MRDDSIDESLVSLGERRIIDELIKPTFSRTQAVLRGVGDDTAALSLTPGYELLVTIDPCPTPVVALLGDCDLWHWGRLTHVISLSDLAASGARPLGMVVSTIMPENMTKVDYKRYIEALEHYSQAWGCPIIGGNIKDGTEFSSCSTALGEAPLNTSMTRRGARPGDAVCVVGKVGYFWSAVLCRMRSWRDIESTYADIFEKALIEPIPRIREGRILGDSGRVTACIDASDGLGAALESLAHSNRGNLLIEESMIPLGSCVREVASREGLHPLALALSWGDWQLVFSASREDAIHLVEIIRDIGSPCCIIGHVDITCNNTNRLLLRDRNGNIYPIRSFASERFRNSSYFTHGLESYIELLRLGLFLGDSWLENMQGWTT